MTTNTPSAKAAKVAEVSKKWFRLRDSYGVVIDPGQDDVLVLAVAVCIDEMAHEGHLAAGQMMYGDGSLLINAISNG